VSLKGRTVTICFDADACTNPHVQRAMIRLGRWLLSKAVKKVWYLIVPAEHNGVAVKGADDFFAAGGTLEELKTNRLGMPPNTTNMTLGCRGRDGVVCRPGRLDGENLQVEADTRGLAGGG
jgi:hypothetical protein